MKLVIISNMDHWRDPAGQIVGHGATARELDALASLFDEVRHVACLSDAPAPASALPYHAANLTLVPVPPAGGESLTAKLAIVRLTPRYLRTMLRELRTADAVHIRAPANIPLYAIAMLPLLRSPARRWVKYAGNWKPTAGEPRSYGLQRAMLARTAHRAQVTINGAWPDQPAHVHSFRNPSLTDEELARGAAAARDKTLRGTLRFVYAGNLIANKHPEIAIATLEQLVRRGIDATLDIAGDGAERATLTAAIERAALGARVTLHGALSRTALEALYARAHFVVLPSATEGWPKVLSEGMAAGAVPIATGVGSIPQELAAHGTGTVVSAPPTPAAFADAIAAYRRTPERWALERDRAVAGARFFSYSEYLNRVRDLLDL